MFKNVKSLLTRIHGIKWLRNFPFHFSTELLGCYLWFLGKILFSVTSRNAKEIFILKFKFVLVQRIAKLGLSPILTTVIPYSNFYNLLRNKVNILHVQSRHIRRGNVVDYAGIKSFKYQLIVSENEQQNWKVEAVLYKGNSAGDTEIDTADDINFQQTINLIRVRSCWTTLKTF